MTDIYDLAPADNDDEDLNLDGAGWYGAEFLADDDITTADLGIFIKHLNFDESQAYGSTGTGLFNPFLRVNAQGTSRGFNLQDNTQKQNKDAGTDMDDAKTNAIQLKDIPIVYLDLDGLPGLEAYYVINLDINENVDNLLGLTEMQIFISDTEATFADYIYDTDQSGLAFDGVGAGQKYQLVFDLDDPSTGGDKTLVLDDLGAGQGKQDYIFYLPVAMFEAAGAHGDSFMTLFSQFGPTPPDDGAFNEWNTIVAPKVSGVKFGDLDGDGIKDANETGLSGFTMFIDIDGDGLYDAGELTAVSGAGGVFQFASLVDAESYKIYEILSEDDIDTANNAFTAQQIADLLPDQSGDWVLTTGDVNGGHTITFTGTAYAPVQVGNFLANPLIVIEKEAISIIGSGGENKLVPGADAAGDVVNYVISVANEGNVDLDITSLTDINADTLVYVSGDTDNDDILDVGETWIFNSTHVVDQSTLDTDGIDIFGDGDFDEDIDNRVDVEASWSFNGQGGTVSDFDIEDVPVVVTPDISILKEVVSVNNEDESLDEDGIIDTAGDTITYRITVANEGNVTLSDVDVTDLFEGAGYDTSGLVYVESGDENGLLDVGETWTWVFTVEVTQLMIDTNCYEGGDEQITNSASVTALFGEQQVSDGPSTVNTPIDCDPVLSIDKVVIDVDGDGAEGTIDAAGDIVTYEVTVTNDGNVTLTGVKVSDPLTGLELAVAGDGTLAPGESYTFENLTYEVTQDDMDSNGTIEPDDVLPAFLDNTATAYSDQTEPVSDDEDVPLEVDPDISILKEVVSVNNEDESLDEDGIIDTAGDTITYRITVANEGNVTLSDVDVTDLFEGAGYDTSGLVYVESGDENGLLDVGETWTWVFTVEVTQLMIDTNCYEGGDE
ncbi:DUF11 domain-containing protein, partial [Qipengyuania gaetbuli]|uniref:DUF7507 domain-containing protein n=1 Tax=Qipengyuania gaetbuli TaxID=266952 RepID=UPI001CD54918